MTELVIPYALGEWRQLCSPDAAQKSRKYFCPSCGSPVVFKSGSLKAAHFAHKASSVCTQESITHLLAKILLQGIVSDWLAGKAGSPEIARFCRHCNQSVTQKLPDAVDGVALEVKLTDGSVVDVALLGGDVVKAAIEVRVTHAVESGKAARLPVPFIEVNGYDVLDNPRVWSPLLDRFRPACCPSCKSNLARFLARSRQIAEACNLELPERRYRYGISRCWSCKREILVFAWPDIDIRDDPHRPKIIQYRNSKRRGRCWVNTCAYCNHIQEPYYLKLPEGPFFCTNCDEDTAKAYKNDLMRIANYAARVEGV